MKIMKISIVALAIIFGASASVRAEEAHQHEHQHGAATSKAAAAAPAGSMTETGQVLQSKDFFRAANAYQIAEEMPQTLDALYCYCKCKESPTLQHKTLLTCYTTDHAAKCGICMHEAEVASDLTKHGKSISEIRAAVDAFYKAKEKEKK